VVSVGFTGVGDGEGPLEQAIISRVIVAKNKNNFFMGERWQTIYREKVFCAIKVRESRRHYVTPRFVKVVHLKRKRLLD